MKDVYYRLLLASLLYCAMFATPYYIEYFAYYSNISLVNMQLLRTLYYIIAIALFVIIAQKILNREIVDLGVGKDKVIKGLAFFVFLFVFMNLINYCIALFSNNVQFNTEYSLENINKLLIVAIIGIIGRRLHEELFLRGMIISYLRTREVSQYKSIGISVLISVIYFVLLSIPVPNQNKILVVSIFTFQSLFFLLMYILSDNLFIAASFRIVSREPFACIDYSAFSNYNIGLILALFIIIYMYKRYKWFC